MMFYCAVCLGILWKASFTTGADAHSVSKAPIQLNVPSKGLSQYIGRTSYNSAPAFTEDIDKFYPPSTFQKLVTRFNLWRQYPWNKIDTNNNILKVKLSGSMSVEYSSPLSLFHLGPPPDMEAVDSLADMCTMLNLAAYDPRITAVLIDIGDLRCGYAKLTELRRALDFFRQSNKTVIGHSETANQKTLYLALSLDGLYVPPDGSVETLGFSAEAQFLRGVFDKVGIEPQTQRIGKYKSLGDSFNRTTMSDAQREVASSLLIETSEHWAHSVAEKLNKTVDQVKSLWSDVGVKTPNDYKEHGYISGVKYYDQVVEQLKVQYSREQPGSLVRRLTQWISRFFETKAQKTAKQLAISEAMTEAQQQSDFNMSVDFRKYPRRTEAFTIETVNASAAGIRAIADAYTAAANTLFDVLSEESPVGAVAGGRGVTAGPLTTRGAMIHRRQTFDKITGLVPPEFLPARTYLKKMRHASCLLQGMRMVEVTRGPRIAIINAEGGISDGRSGPGSVGGTTVIEQLREAKDDPNICGLVLRINSPGGAALASDLLWREIRCVSRVKPVVASMVDVAASGGYYLAMACDQIVAEETTLTGSIGVVANKFNAQELTKKVGLGVETMSIGRHAEMKSATQPFSPEDAAYFEQFAQLSYDSFTAKAAASRNMSVEHLQKVAQGRVWTGKQAIERGLVDQIGGLTKAVQLAANLSTDYLPTTCQAYYALLKANRTGERSSLLNSTNTNHSSAADYLKSLRSYGDRYYTRYPKLRVQTFISGGSGFRALARRRVAEVVTETVLGPLVNDLKLHLGGGGGGGGQSAELTMDDTVRYTGMVDTDDVTGGTGGGGGIGLRGLLLGFAKKVLMGGIAR